MPKKIKEFLLDQATGSVATEFDDDSVSSFNLSNSLSLAGGDLTKGGVALTAAEQAAVRGGFDRQRLSNARASNTLRARRMLTRVALGEGRGRILILGDSTTAGAGAGTGAVGLVGAMNKSWAKKLAVLLTSSGIPASQISLTGAQGVVSQLPYSQYDPRLALGTGWGDTIGTLGGNSWLFTSGSGVGSLVLTETCTHFAVFYAAGFSSGTATVTVDGGASLGTISAAGGYDMKQQTFSAGAIGPHAISINAQNNGNFMVAGIVCWDASQPGIDIIQAAQFGATTAPFNVADGGSAPWASKAMIAEYEPDLTIIELGVNSVRSSVSAATYQSELESIVAAAKAVGDVILMDFLPDGLFTGVEQDAHITAAYSAAVSQGVPFFSINEAFGASKAWGQAKGFYYDDVHLFEAGYQHKAEMIFCELMALVKL